LLLLLLLTLPAPQHSADLVDEVRRVLAQHQHV
jgi:hypothetical protein